jgi:hypothetical protein
MRVSIIGPNLRDQSKGQFHVHAEGCADIKRMVRREPEYAYPDTFEVTTKMEAVTEVYDPGDFEWDPDDESLAACYLDDLHFFPCCDGLPTK